MRLLFMIRLWYHLSSKIFLTCSIYKYKNNSLKREKKWFNHNSSLPRIAFHLPVNMLMPGAIKLSLKQAIVKLFT